MAQGRTGGSLGEYRRRRQRATQGAVPAGRDRLRPGLVADPRQPLRQARGVRLGKQSAPVPAAPPFRCADPARRRRPRLQGAEPEAAIAGVCGGRWRQALHHLRQSRPEAGDQYVLRTGRRLPGRWLVAEGHGVRERCPRPDPDRLRSALRGARRRDTQLRERRQGTDPRPRAGRRRGPAGGPALGTQLHLPRRAQPHRRPAPRRSLPAPRQQPIALEPQCPLQRPVAHRIRRQPGGLQQQRRLCLAGLQPLAPGAEPETQREPDALRGGIENLGDQRLADDDTHFTYAEPGRTFHLGLVASF